MIEILNVKLLNKKSINKRIRLTVRGFNGHKRKEVLYIDMFHKHICVPGNLETEEGVKEHIQLLKFGLRYFYWLYLDDDEIGTHEWSESEWRKYMDEYYIPRWGFMDKECEQIAKDSVLTYKNNEYDRLFK